MKTLFNVLGCCSLIILACCGSVVSESYSTHNDSINKEINYIPYYLKVYEAKELFEKENFLESFEILDSLFKIYKPLNQMMVYEYNIYLESAFLSNNHQIFPEAVVKGIEDFGISGYYFENKESTMYSVYKTAKINPDKYKTHWDSYVSKLNLGLRDTIKQMMIRDQYNGRKMDTDRDREILDSIGKINEKLLVYIFEKYGFPNEDLIGNGPFSVERNESPRYYNIAPMLKHFDDSITQYYFIPKMLEFVKKGEAIPYFYASLYDKKQIVKNNEQVYGTFSNVKIKDSLKVDSIRQTIGLPKLRK